MNDQNTSTPKLKLSYRRSRLCKTSPSHKGSFKSPLLQTRKIGDAQALNASEDSLRQSIKELWEKNEITKKQIEALEQEGFEEEELQWYIEKMHVYNETKDAAQLVMGRIAFLERKTVKEVHMQFGLNVDD